MSETPNLITLMTDFGHDDVFVGVMKGVIAGINPSARVIDLAHGISPFNVVEAAFRLAQAYTYFPKGSVHVVVVDPGVGGDRRIVAMRSDGHIFLAPDNGVLSVVAEDKGHEVLIEVAEKRFSLPDVSSTFHGRDIFAPVAAHIAAGTPLEELGAPADKLRMLSVPEAAVSNEGVIEGQILWTDRFGNLITNIPARMVEARAKGRVVTVQVGSMEIAGLRRSYSEVQVGEPLAMIGSFGMLEVAVRQGSAAAQLGVNRGKRLRVAFT